MATLSDIFNQYASVAICELTEKGFLLDTLDWDKKGQKYTLRIRGADRKPMVGVGLITFQNWKHTITLIDAVKGSETKFQFDPDNKENKSDFLNCVLIFAKQLREEASYK